jgi:hypothetical protein
MLLELAGMTLCAAAGGREIIDLSNWPLRGLFVLLMLLACFRCVALALA